MIVSFALTNEIVLAKDIAKYLLSILELEEQACYLQVVEILWENNVKYAENTVYFNPGSEASF